MGYKYIQWVEGLIRQTLKLKTQKLGSGGFSHCNPEGLKIKMWNIKGILLSHCSQKRLRELGKQAIAISRGRFMLE